VKKIILASKSPRRREILEMIGVDFEVIPSEYIEDMGLDMKPRELVEYLSRGKAEDVAGKVGEGLIIGADTIAVVGGRAVGKIGDKEEVKKIFKKSSGSSCALISAFTIIEVPEGKSVTRSEVTNVFFGKISANEIERFLETDEWKGKAGGFAIEGMAAIFVRRIEGDYYNIGGLPVYMLANELRRFGVDVIASA
jgi:septum formation protein